ncbi:translation initiation factor IF-3 [Minwuia thermotolerans]|uniref:Translation initiation factor IF-3 n=1 Tax=Minwuia thermotolerans TaxID=2056226 RepID=A0A2M9G177_9PROT|nr:translation initiation factor IF-3 [Minwuia thermotolerans]PJK29477.1 translation initiation factor IF-3 [Minwuia thermotolerans]
MQSAPVRDGPRANDMIDSREIRLIDHEGNNHGVVATVDALKAARTIGLDLVEVSPTAKPPVCKLMDLGKYKYEEQKKANVARKKQKTVDVKEIKMRPNIDDHDYTTKMKKVVEFIGDGDKVKVTMRFRGREMAHQELGLNVMKRVQEEMAETAKVEQHPKTEGRQMIMVLAPR